jgi:cardiolipin synthase (CMP-forming)
MQEDLQLRLNPLRSAPNLLTLMRICLAPFLVAAILEGHFLLSFILFVAAGLTDALDGLLARLLKQRSMLGQYLDPVADKLLLSTLFLVLFYKGLMPGTVTVLVFGRDVGILLVAAIFMRPWGGASSSQHLRQGQHAGPDQRRRGRLLHQVTPSWYWVAVTRSVALAATIALTVASGCIMRGWFRAARAPRSQRRRRQIDRLLLACGRARNPAACAIGRRSL